MAIRSAAETFRFGGKKMVGVLATPGLRRKVPGVLMLHGFPGSEQNVDIQRALLDVGIATFRLQFQGAWGSEGNYLFSTLIDQAKGGLHYFARRPEVDARRLAVFGFSMGGWTALNLAGVARDLRAVVAVGPVGGTEMIAPSNRPFIRSHCKPLRVTSPDALVRDFRRSVTRFPPVKAVLKSNADFLVIHGAQDEVIPAAASKRLQEVVGKKRMQLVLAPGARHDFLAHRPWLTRRVIGWLKTRLRG
ncbi:MAG: hypothetical protein COB53_05125 [Elusimicrobia bacterium]|nr:MAG: hypothetical protein COB53_05125 [Elusimicrobiota bacterium]